MSQEIIKNNFIELLKSKLTKNHIEHYVCTTIEGKTKIIEFKDKNNKRTFLGLFFLEYEPHFSDVVLLPINDAEMYHYLGIIIGSQIKVFLQHKRDNEFVSQKDKFQFLIDKPLLYKNIEDATDDICKVLLSQLGT